MERGVGEGGWRGDGEGLGKAWEGGGFGEGGWRGYGEGLVKAWGRAGEGWVGEGLGRAWLSTLQNPV